MDNSFFILSKQETDISRFHICTWDVENKDSFVEIGFEFIFPEGVKELEFKLVAPFITGENTNQIKCLLSNLISDTENSKFIFNDNVRNFSYLDDSKKGGGILNFKERDSMTVLPIKAELCEQAASIKVKNQNSDVPLSYIRFLIKSDLQTLARIKKGITKTDFIFDIKLNERRNMPENVFEIVKDEYLFCNVRSCFCFHVIPNSYNISYIDQNKLRNIRELEVITFKKYLPDELNTMKDGKYIIVFNKDQGTESYSFFSIFTKETIGTKQIMFAIAANILCSLLFAFSSYRQNLDESISFCRQISVEYWIALAVLTLLIFSLFSPMKQIKKLFNRYFR